MHTYKRTSIYHFVRVSGNSKTGPIPVVATVSASCPVNCPLQSNGCYAGAGMVGLHWRKLDKGEYGIDIDTLCTHIKGIPHGQLWRMNTAGDLAHHAQSIDVDTLTAIVAANKGRQGFTYTHHLIEGDTSIALHNRETIRAVNTRKTFTINLSANNLEHADKLSALECGPVVTLLDSTEKIQHTPQGRIVIVCPAVTADNITCDTCRLCYRKSRKSIVGFPVHGSGKNKARKVFIMHKG